MFRIVKHVPEMPLPIMDPVDQEIREFLAGDSDGEDLLHALYDHVLDEPIPERLRAILRG